MIGAINETKGKAKPGPATAATQPRSKVKADLTHTAKSTHPVPGAKPQPMPEHAGDADES
jgi:hypothetical protein